MGSYRKDWGSRILGAVSEPMVCLAHRAAGSRFLSHALRLCGLKATSRPPSATERLSPGPPTARCKLENGFIVPPSHLELPVVDHCNLTCRACNHASPAVRAWFADPVQVRKDFSLLARYYRPKIVKVIGGEPLMHKRLVELLEALRDTGITNHINLSTNGVLLHRASDAMYELIDELEISIYPAVQTELGDILDLASSKCEQFRTKLSLNTYEQFRATFAGKGTQDRSLVGKVFKACKIAHLWGCHSVRDGYLFRCPQSVAIAQLQGRATVAGGIELADSPDLQQRLLAFVNSSEPIPSCAYCVGTSGRQEPHVLVDRNSWRRHIDYTTEDLLDRDWLERSLIAQDRLDDCKVPVRLKPKKSAKLLSRFRKKGGVPPGQLFKVEHGQQLRRQRADEARLDASRKDD